MEHCSYHGRHDSVDGSAEKAVAVLQETPSACWVCLAIPNTDATATTATAKPRSPKTRPSRLIPECERAESRHK